MQEADSMKQWTAGGWGRRRGSSASARKQAVCRWLLEASMLQAHATSAVQAGSWIMFERGSIRCAAGCRGSQGITSTSASSSSLSSASWAWSSLSASTPHAFTVAMQDVATRVLCPATEALNIPVAVATAYASGMHVLKVLSRARWCLQSPVLRLCLSTVQPRSRPCAARQCTAVAKCTFLTRACRAAASVVSCAWVPRIPDAS